MVRAVSAVALVALLAACAAALKGGPVTRAKQPAAWENVSDMFPPHQRVPLTLTFAIRQQNLDELRATVLAVSDPDSPKYRHFLSKERVDELTASLPEHRATVLEWLSAHGVTGEPHANTPDFVVARTNIGEVERLLPGVKFSTFRHRHTGDVIARTLSPVKMPKKVAEAIDFVSGLNTFPRRLEAPFTPRAPASGSNAPYIARIVAGDGMLASFFMPRCMGGEYSTSASEPCSDNPPALADVSVRVDQGLYPQSWGLNEMTAASSLTCKACSAWSGSFKSICSSAVSSLNVPDSAVFCVTPPLGPVANYQRLNISQYSMYQDSNTYSDTGVYARPVYLGVLNTPSTLLDRYQVPLSAVVSSTSSNSQSVAEFLGQYYSPSDLDMFFEIMGVVPAQVEVIGPNDDSDPGGEASLDIQYIMGLAQNITTTFWSFGDLHDGQEPFLEWITAVLNDASPPLVHSISYGDDEPSLDVDYMQRIDVEFQKAGARGLSIIFSSGDNGVNAADPSNEDSCTVAQHFVPGFPASSPFVTAVGGTQFSTHTYPACDMGVMGVPVNCGTLGEITSSIATGSRITSGGGFSDVFAMPSYQESVVKAYLKEIGSSIPSQYYNASGRAYPDISACARNFVVVISGLLDPVDGTSASAPTVAAIVSLLNEQLLARGKPPLGFLNPLLYNLARTNQARYFNDIIVGDNSCGEDISNCCPYGYSATIGWDAVTGVGSPRFTSLLETILLL